MVALGCGLHGSQSTWLLSSTFCVARAVLVDLVLRFGRKAPAALGDSLLGLVAVFPCSGVLGLLHGNAKSIMFTILSVSLEVPLSDYHCMSLS